MSSSMRVLIVGGVAGGASCAARLRRLTEAAKITIFERQANVSYANCGLPYRIGDVITDDAKLLVATAAKFRSWFAVDVRERTEVVAVDRTARTVTARDLATGREYSEPFDALVLAPGARAVRPPLPGIDLPGIFTVKTIPDASGVRAHIEAHNVESAVVIGAGFIGLEMAENLVHRGIRVTVLEAAPQVLPPLDAEMARPVAAHLEAKGVEVVLGDGVAGFEARPNGGVAVRTAAGRVLEAGLAILAIGVRPETDLARAAGLELGARGGIRVDGHMRTSDPAIYAVGDAVETKDWVTGEYTICALAGPANRQGRVAADAIAGRADAPPFRGCQGTAVVGLFGLAAACTGASERTLKRVGRAYAKVYTHPNNHAAYYPGATPIDLKVLFDPADGALLGAQAVGAEGAERRVDVVAALMQKRGTVYDLEELELCYAPQFGSAKDALNLAGMVAANSLRGDHPLAAWDELEAKVLPEVAAGKALLVDVREPAEVARGTVRGAVNFPLSTLRQRLDELPRDRRIYVFCQVGLRGYNATRQLLLSGRDAVNITGGWRSALDAGVAPGEAAAKL